MNALNAEIDNIEDVANEHIAAALNEFDAIHPDELMTTDSESDTNANAAEDSDEPEYDSDDDSESENSETDAEVEVSEDSDNGIRMESDDDVSETMSETMSETVSNTVTGGAGGGAIDEIRRLQAKTDFLIPFASFNRLVREIASEYCIRDLRFTKNAILALQTATESTLIGLFSTSQLMAIHGGRQSIEPKDMQLAQRAMNPDCRGI